MAKVVTFGELMLRLAPNGYYRFFQNDQMQATFGGGEANVAVSLANYGMDSVYVTKLPKHAIGQAAVDSLRYFGVDTSKSFAVAKESVFIILKRVLLKEAQFVFMTASIPLFNRQQPLILIGMIFSRVLTGSILQVSLPH